VHCHHHPQDGRPARNVLRLDSVNDVERAFGVVEAFAAERMRILRG
jgi:hypothetical protein